jgi:5-hydroxyisourate hydrolase
MSRAPITTHILNLHTGKPAAGVEVTLKPLTGEERVYTATTDGDGRVSLWSEAFELSAGSWQIRFASKAWFAAQGQSSFYDDVDIRFQVVDLNQHYHVPLLLNAHGYSTYRGS